MDYNIFIFRMKTHFLYISFFLFFSYNCISQNTKKRYTPLKVVSYDDNVNTPFTADEMLQLKEVYGASLENKYS